jgi:hypothetical protein
MANIEDLSLLFVTPLRKEFVGKQICPTHRLCHTFLLGTVPYGMTINTCVDTIIMIM